MVSVTFQCQDAMDDCAEDFCNVFENMTSILKFYLSGGHANAINVDGW